MKRGAAERIVAIVDRLETLASLDELVAAVAAPVALPAAAAAPALSST
jgi:ribosomal protein L12E/L44/L45/RPP1/RPP2